MRINLICPENWVLEIVPHLREHFDVMVNSSEKADLAICMSDSQLPKLLAYHHDHPEVPMINYLWDLYSFQDYTAEKWQVYFKILYSSLDVWTPTYDVSQDLYQMLGRHSYVVPSFFPKQEWLGQAITPSVNGKYAVQASRHDHYKRFDWFEEACNKSNIPFISCHPDKYSREEFRKIMADCKFVVVSSTEESMGTLSAMEAVYNLKPVLMSDCIQGGREVWHNTIEYFKWNNKEELALMIAQIWNGDYAGNPSQARELLEINHSYIAFCHRVAQRIKQLMPEKFI